MVADGLVRTSRGPRQNGVRPSADPLFRSAALYGGPRTIAVVLSGSLDDAALGATVEQCGGHVIVQDPGEASYGSMPRCAVATTQRPAIRPAHRIAELVLRLTRETAEVPRSEPPPGLGEEIRGLLASDPRITPVPQDYSGFTCPECGGPLYHAGEHAADNYDCLVGHRWSPESLLEQQAGTVERAMWLAIRSLDERRRLTGRLAEAARSQGHAISAARFHAAAEEAGLAADVIRSAASKLTPVAQDPVADQLTAGETRQHAHQRHELLPGSAGLADAAGAGDTRAPGGQGGQDAGPGVERGLRHRRGSLHPRDRPGRGPGRRPVPGAGEDLRDGPGRGRPAAGPGRGLRGRGAASPMRSEEGSISGVILVIDQTAAE